jgi:hypothetical protein
VSVDVSRRLDEDLARETKEAHLFPALHTEGLDLFQRSVLLDVAIGGGEFLQQIICLFRELPDGREELIMGHRKRTDGLYTT